MNGKDVLLQCVNTIQKYHKITLNLHQFLIRFLCIWCVQYLPLSLSFFGFLFVHFINNNDTYTRVFFEVTKGLYFIYENCCTFTQYNAKNVCILNCIYQYIFRFHFRIWSVLNVIFVLASVRIFFFFNLGVSLLNLDWNMLYHARETKIIGLYKNLSFLLFLIGVCR